MRIGLFIVAATAGSLFCQTRVHATRSVSPSGPGVLSADLRGNVYVADRDGIFRMDATGLRSRVATAKPSAIAADSVGNLYIADSGDNLIWKLAAATGVMTVAAGNGVRGFSGDGGSAIDASLDRPTGVAVDSAGILYIADGTVDGTNRIRRVAAGVITTVAGNGSQGYSGDGGAATLAQFRSLGGLATDAMGDVYIADNYNHRIRKLSAASGVITTVAGNGIAGFSGDGGLATEASLNNPLGVAIDAAGNLFIADSGNFRVRKVNAGTGTIETVGNADLVYQDTQHGFPRSLAFDAAGTLYIADSGTFRIRRVRAGQFGALLSSAPQTLPTNNFKINVTYGTGVPSAAQTAFNSLISTYENLFTNNITVNIDVEWGVTGLGESDTQQVFETYSAWRGAMMANATANSGNTYAVAAAASLPASDPIGNSSVLVNTSTARALGLTANVAVDSTLTFTNVPNTFEYTGTSTAGFADFLDTAAHELDEALGIGSALTGLADNAPIPTGNYEAQDYFRYSASGVRAITTNPNAAVYFSYDGGNANVAQFNQAYSAQGDTGLDRNDWVYGNFGCPVANPHVQDAIICLGQVVPVGSGVEITVLNALGYNSTFPQTITFSALSNVTYGVAPFTISAAASSGLPVTFSSGTTPVCTVSGTTVTIVAAGGCSITASQAGNATYSPAPPVTRSFTVAKAAQTITFGPLGNVTYGVAPFTISASSTSGLGVAFTSTTTAVCTVSGSTVTIVGTGMCSITASQAGNGNYLAATPVVRQFTVNPTVAAVGVSPAAGSAATQTFTFTFTDGAGYADLSVLDVLISTFLDGQTACYFALAPTGATTGYIYLVDDAGDGGYAGPPMPLPSASVVQNSQCAINGTGSSVSASGNTLTLTLSITFKSAFEGNKAVYMAARSNTQNSGWQSLGSWDVPGTVPAGPAVGGVSPARSTSMGQTYTFTFTDTNGYADLFVLDVLTNSFLVGNNACYFAYVPTTPTNGYLYLVDDAGDGGYAPGSPIALSSGGSLQNSQCTISTTGSSASASGNTLTLHLAIAFKAAFAGNQVFFMAARNNSTGNSGWQAAGSVTVP